MNLITRIRTLMNAVVVAMLSCLISPAASAAGITFDILLLSKSEALVTVAGTLPDTIPPGAQSHILVIHNPFTNALNPYQNNSLLVDSSVTAGIVPLQDVHDVGSGFAYPPANSIYLAFNDYIYPNQNLSGSFHILLTPGDQFLPEGSNGLIGWGGGDGFQPSVVGQWNITAVPEPNIATLFIAGVAIFAARSIFRSTYKRSSAFNPLANFS